jgi:hypothetical protein
MTIRFLTFYGKRAGLLALAGALSVAALLSGSAAAADRGAGGANDQYQQIATLTAPGIPSYQAPAFTLAGDIIFVDPALHRVYFSDFSNVQPGTHGLVHGAVDAWDTRTFKFVGTMFGGFTGIVGFPTSFETEGPDGVVADNLGHIWAGNGPGAANDGTVMVGDARTMKEIAVIRTGEQGRADELAYDPVNQTILVTNPGASPPGWTLIDARTFKILGHATLGAGVSAGSIEQPQFDPVLGKFVTSVAQLNSHDTHGALAVVDTQVSPHSQAVQASAFPLSVTCNPLGLTIGPGRDLLAGCISGGPVIVSASQAGFQTDQQITQACCSDEVWYDPHLGRYYTASFRNPNGTGSNPVVTVIDAQRRSFITMIPIRRLFTQDRAPDLSFHAVAADPATGYVYVPAAAGIRVFAATAGAAVATAPDSTSWSITLSWAVLGIAVLGCVLFEANRRRRKRHSAA